jgi:REP-associated tyrosine transposase
MAYVKIWLHCVWGTKRKVKFLKGEIKKSILDHIKENAVSKEIHIDIINGNDDHIHCLLSLGADQALSYVMQLIKGESSFWVNKNRLTKYKFKWAVEYFAVSISESHLKRVRNYIRNQEEHHRKKNWQEEQDKLLLEYGFERILDNPRAAALR